MTVRVLRNDESIADYGSTLTQFNGEFVMAVNGGGVLTVVFEKDGFLTVQRQVDARQQHYSQVDAIVMTPRSSVSTVIDLSLPTPIQVALGDVVTDQDGTRQATLMFAAGTQATMVKPDSSTQFIMWTPVAISVLVVGTTLLDLGVRVLLPRLAQTKRRVIVATYAITFAAVVLFVDESFSMIVRFYGPALMFFLIVAAREAIGTRAVGWGLLFAGFAVSVAAAVIQVTGVAIHPVYFDHNAVYHLVQGGAVVLLYLGFGRAPWGSADLSAASSSD